MASVPGCRDDIPVTQLIFIENDKQIKSARR